ncbi:MAG: hypothetical protein IJ303_00660, partial [Clostridia bacterium]|nr:hypothetical protein [Clostridia bacterium]
KYKKETKYKKEHTNEENSQHYALIEKKYKLEKELDYAKSFEKAKLYSSYFEREDFAENSKYAPQKTGESSYNVFSDTFITGYADNRYEMINGNEDVILAMRNNNRKLGDARADEYLLQLTSDEKAIYNYIYKTEGREKADEFIEMLKPELNERSRKKDQAEWGEMAKESPVSTSAFSVFLSLRKGKVLLNQLVDYLDDGKIDQNASYNADSYISSAIRGGVSENMNDVGTFFYQAGMSLADFLASTVAGGGGNLSLAIMGSGAAADATIEARDRGLDSSQALGLGITVGAIEALTEKVSLSTMLNKVNWEKSALSYFLKNIFEEAGEEITSELCGDIADILISKDKSHWHSAVEAYMAEGKGFGEAFARAFGDGAIEVVLAGLGGGLSGAVIGGGGAAASTFKKINHNKNMGKDVLKSENGLSALLDDALKYPKYTKGYEIAKKIDEKISAGKKPTEKEVGELAQIWTKRRHNMEATELVKTLAGEGKTLRQTEKAIRDEGYDFLAISYGEIEAAYNEALAAEKTETMPASKDYISMEDF